MPIASSAPQISDSGSENNSDHCILLDSRSDESQHNMNLCVGRRALSTIVRTKEYIRDGSNPYYTRLEALIERSGGYNDQSNIRPPKKYRCSNDRQHTDQLA